MSMRSVPRRVASAISVVCGMTHAACAACAACAAATTTTTTTTRAADIDPAATVRRIRQEEAWLDRSKSVRIRFEGVWRTPPEAVERRRAELKKRFPNTQPTTKQFADLAPIRREVLEFGYDDRQMYARQEDPTGPGTFNRRAWDGRQAIAHEKYSADQEHYALQRTPYQFLRDTFSMGAWPRAGLHRL